MEEKKYETVIVLNSSRFGSGNPRLGESLMKDFLDCLSKTDPKPDALLLYNTAATLACKDSPVLEEMKKLEENGIEVFASLESLMFYGMSEDRQAGGPVNMDMMVQMMMNAKKVIKP